MSYVIIQNKFILKIQYYTILSMKERVGCIRYQRDGAAAESIIYYDISEVHSGDSGLKSVGSDGITVNFLRGLYGN